MSGPACLRPRLLIKLYDAVMQGRLPEALDLQERLSALSDLFLRFNLASCVKAGLNHLGYSVGDPIPPQEPLTGEQTAEVAKVLDSLEQNGQLHVDS